MSAIFVSYRRSDSPGAAGRLCDHLIARFGADQVFRDVDNILPGEDFEDVIVQALRTAAVVIVVVGPRWVEARDPAGRRRLDDPDDYLRREIEIALAGDALLLPVLVEGAAPLPPAGLPESIRTFARRQAVRLSDGQWREDAANLIERIVAVLEDDETPVVTASHRQSPMRDASSTAAAAVAGYPADLVAMLRAPRRELYSRSVAPDAALGAIVFFVISVALSDAMLMSFYRPRASILVSVLSSLVFALFATLALSVPVWAVWRAVGARAGFSRSLTVLFYQIGVAHLLVFSAIAIGLMVIEVRSVSTISRAMTAALEVEGSIAVAVTAMAEAVLAAVDTRTMVVATGIALAGVLAAGVFLLRAWGAYADAFGASRRQAVSAAVLLLVIVFALPLLASGFG